MTTQRIVTGAHYGLKGWLAQRITAVILVLYTLWLVAALAGLPKFDYANWRLIFISPFARVSTLLAVLAVVYHAWIGMRDVWMDYIKPTGLRLLLEVATIVLLAGYALWAVVILWRV